MAWIGSEYTLGNPFSLSMLLIVCRNAGSACFNTLSLHCSLQLQLALLRDSESTANMSLGSTTLSYG